jgi:hypothetical protein
LYQKPRQFYIIARIIMDSSMNSRLTGSRTRVRRAWIRPIFATNRGGIFDSLQRGRDG